MKLYEIASDVENVINGGMIVDGETGEIIFDSENLDELEMALNDKLEACGCYIKNLQAEADMIGNEIKALRARESAAKGKVSRMKEYVLKCMEMASKKRFETPKVALSQRKSYSVEIKNILDVPEDFKEIEEVAKVDKMAVKALMKDGQEIPGCELKENLNLQVK